MTMVVSHLLGFCPPNTLERQLGEEASFYNPKQKLTIVIRFTKLQQIYKCTKFYK